MSEVVKKRARRILNVVLLIAVMIFFLSLVVDTKETVISFIQTIVFGGIVVGFWETVKWMDSPSWHRCPEKDCNFKVKVDDEYTRQIIMGNHHLYHHAEE